MKRANPHRRISLGRQKAAELEAARQGWRDGRAGRHYAGADFETVGERDSYDRMYSKAKQGQLTIEDTDNGN